MTPEIPTLILRIWMLCCIAGGLIGVGIYFTRSFGNRKANFCYGFLLLVFTLSLANNLLIFQGASEALFLPIWYTLLFGPLFFFFIKFLIYPAYRLRFSDLKHLFLPILQASFYWIVFFFPQDRQLEIYHQLYLPYFKTIEGGLFVLSFFGYLAIAYRYLKYKESTLRIRGYNWQLKKIRWFRTHVKVLFLLAGLNTFYIIADFISYNFLNFNLYNLPGYGYLVDLSFSVVLIWLAWKGWQWAKSRETLTYMAPLNPDDGQLPLIERLEFMAKTDKRFLDPDIQLTHFALATKTKQEIILQSLQKAGKENFHLWIGEWRLNEMDRKKEIQLYRKYHPLSLALISGFPSKNNYLVTAVHYKKPTLSQS